MDTQKNGFIINGRTAKEIADNLQKEVICNNEQHYVLTVINRLHTVFGLNYSADITVEKVEKGYFAHAVLSLKDDTGRPVSKRTGYATENDCTFASQMALVSAAQLYGIPPYIQSEQSHQNCTYAVPSVQQTHTGKSEKAKAQEKNLVALTICSEWQQAKNGQYFCYVSDSNGKDVAGANKPLLVLGGKAQAQISNVVGNVDQYVHRYAQNSIFKCYAEKRVDDVTHMTEYIMIDVFKEN